MNRNQGLFEKKMGFSFIEVIVAASIACLVLGVVIKLYKHFSSQGLQQDKQTIFWSTYCRMTETIREDLTKGFEINFSDPSKISISTIEIDNKYRCSPGTITWNIQGTQKMVRTSESGVVNEFSFSDGLSKNDIIQMNFRKAP